MKKSSYTRIHPVNIFLGFSSISNSDIDPSLILAMTQRALYGVGPSKSYVGLVPKQPSLHNKLYDCKSALHTV